MTAREGSEPTLFSLATRALQVNPAAEALAIARESFVDTAACILAGADSPQPRATLHLAAGTAGPGLTALRLGVAGHAADFDDYEPVGSTHPSSVLVPAILAVAAERPSTLGAALQAYVAGYNTILALGAALGYGHYLAGWHSTSTIAGIGAAAAVSRLLDLGTAETVSAMSLATSQAAGLKRQFGSDAKALHAGFAARAGVESALLAKAGLIARAEVADGAEGFFALYGGGQAPGWRATAPDIGVQPPYRKSAPCCGYALRAVDAAAGIARRSGFDAAEVEAVEIWSAAPYLDVVRFTAPVTAHEARFSLTWCVAATLLRGGLGPDAFAAEALADPQHLALEALCRLAPYPLPPGLGDMSPEAPDRVLLTLRDGRTFTETCAVPPGGPGRAFTRDDLLAKLSACGGDPAAGGEILDAPASAPFPGPGRLMAALLT